MSRVLKENSVILGISKNKYDVTVEYIVKRMDLILTSPEDVIIKEGETLESKFYLIYSTLSF